MLANKKEFFLTTLFWFISSLSAIISMLATISVIKIFNLPMIISVILRFILAILFVFVLNKFWLKQKVYYFNTSNRLSTLLLPILIIIIYAIIQFVSLDDWQSDLQHFQLINLIFTFGSAIVEEYQFRGLLLPKFLSIFKGRPETRAIKAILIVSFLFSLNHLTNLLNGQPFAPVIWEVIFAFGISLVLSALYLRTRSLTWPILAHFIVDFFSYLDIYAILNMINQTQIVIGLVVEIALVGLLLFVPKTQLKLFNLKK